MSYHLKKIEKGVYGDVSKIREEFEELNDAIEQKNTIMVMCELADLVGAIEGYAEIVCGISLHDIIIMKNATKRAFTTGHRK